VLEQRDYARVSKPPDMEIEHGIIEIDRDDQAMMDKVFRHQPGGCNFSVGIRVERRIE
jgi:hypothetical protein